MTVAMKKKKKNKINKNWYFTEETEKAIIEYNKLKKNKNDKSTKDYTEELYNKKIYPALHKLAENLINTFKFYYFDIPVSDVIIDVVAYITTKLDNFNEANGRAFSYFSIIGKNYLILNNNRNYKYKVAHTSLSDVSEAGKNKQDLDVLNNSRDGYSTKEKDENLNEFLNLFSDWIKTNSYDIFSTDKELSISLAISDIIARRDNMFLPQNIFKKALYVLVKEQTNRKTSEITKVLAVLKQYYFKEKQKYFNKKYELEQMLSGS